MHNSIIARDFKNESRKILLIIVNKSPNLRIELQVYMSPHINRSLAGLASHGIGEIDKLFDPELVKFWLRLTFDAAYAADGSDNAISE